MHATLVAHKSSKLSGSAGSAHLGRRANGSAEDDRPLGAIFSVSGVLEACPTEQ